MIGLIGNWNYPTSVRFGAGRIAEMPDACRTAGMRRPLLVTDSGLAHTAMVADLLAANEAAGLPTALFHQVQPNPVGPNVSAGVAAFRAGGHDGVIAFGGGSPIDVGKAVAFMAAQERPLWDFEDVGDNYLRARTEGLAPVIAIPTTAGTGAEVGRCSVITNEATRTKKIIFHPRMMPALALLDPTLTLGMPAKMTAWTGMDALSHCIEALCAPGCDPMADGIALEGIRLVHRSLAEAVRDGSNLEARSHMLAAACMGATAFQKGLGAVHALSHPVGALYNTHHGLTNAVFLPYVLAWNRPAIEDRLARVAAYMGMARPSFDGFLEWILALREEIGIPHTLPEIGVDDSRLEEMSRMAEVDPPAAGNPLPVTAKELLTLYECAFSGKLPSHIHD